MNKYVLGFVFDKKLESVLLIKKLKPEWQKGQLNGLGGKIEENETIHEAISREIKEESDLDIPPNQWTHYCTMRGKDWMVECFYFVIDSFYIQKEGIVDGINTTSYVDVYKSMTDEMVGEYSINTCFPHLPNLEWLIPMALNHCKGKEVVRFTVNYE